MAWELAKVEEQRKQVIDLYFDGNLSVREISDMFNISRKTTYKWIHRYHKYGEEGLFDRSKSPINPHKLYSSKVIDKAIEIKLRYQKWGPRKVLAKLLRENPNLDVPSERRLHDIFKDQGLITKKRIRKRVPVTQPLSNVCAPNDTWMGDFKGWFKTKNGQKCEPFTVTDGDSRFLIRCIHLGLKNVENVWAILESAFNEYGLPKRFRTDNGPPFGSTAAGRLTRLSVNLLKAGVTPEWIEPGHPEQNGRHERFHLTLKESIATPPSNTLNMQIRQMQKFIQEYNYERPHEALNMKTPADCYGASPRKWDGRLRSPEYDSSEGMLRKVGLSGSIKVFGREYYIGQALSGEYIQFKESSEKCETYYGQIFLGNFSKEKGLEKIIKKQKNRQNV